MTTDIYFFLMSVIFFIVPQLIVRVLNKEPKVDTNLLYLIFAACLPLIWIFVPKSLAGVREINFIQHFVGGGVACGFVSIYFIKSLRQNYPLLKNFIFQIFFVYALVCMLGVANELLEFSLDVLKVGIFSSDRYDTWFDLTANTTGAILLYLIYYSGSRVLKSQE